jgi:acetoin utilization deacetylase AcuC-like enzyme
MSTAIVFDPLMLEHVTGPSHPERPARLAAIIERLKAAHLWDALVALPSKRAGDDDITLVHAPGYARRVKALIDAGQTHVDEHDCSVSEKSFDAALLAAGAGIAAVDAVMDGRVTNAFCAVRPPGHHAEFDHAMGFCLFGNIAIAAAHLIARRGLSRVAIVDFDVHHGNGTQHLLEGRADVLFISLHEHPSHQYPGTGFAWEIGTGAGKGFTINLPVQPGDGDDVYRSLITSRVLPALREYKPEFLLLSSGFDASEHDPLGHVKLTADCFLWMTRQLKRAAEELCGGRLVSMLEGGYDLRALSEAVALHVGALLEPSDHDGMLARKAGVH